MPEQEPPVEDLIRYDILAQDALRGLVKKVLAEVAKTGLPGNHHFYITFATKAPGVRLSSRLLAKHPDDLTIVLQHQFWDFSVSDHAFEVGLSFGGVPERLLVPFTAVKAFVDPSVKFALQFEPRAPEEGIDETELEEEPQLPRLLHPDLPAEPPLAVPEPDDGKGEGSEDDGKPATAAVVSLDAFRKKS